MSQPDAQSYQSLTQQSWQDRLTDPNTSPLACVLPPSLSRRRPRPFWISGSLYNGMLRELDPRQGLKQDVRCMEVAQKLSICCSWKTCVQFSQSLLLLVAEDSMLSPNLHGHAHRHTIMHRGKALTHKIKINKSLKHATKTRLLRPPSCPWTFESSMKTHQGHLFPALTSKPDQKVGCLGMLRHKQLAWH